MYKKIAAKQLKFAEKSLSRMHRLLIAARLTTL
jgi:hypothetical protein